MERPVDVFLALWVLGLHVADEGDVDAGPVVFADGAAEEPAREGERVDRLGHAILALLEVVLLALPSLVASNVEVTFAECFQIVDAQILEQHRVRLENRSTVCLIR